MVKEGNKENIGDILDNANTPVVIDFWAPWCGPCKMMGPVFEKLSEEFDGKLTFVKVNTQDNPEIAGFFKVRSIPTLSIVHNGAEMERFIGFRGEDHLREQLNNIVAQA